ncbi:MAG: 2-amino-4-hydroxy-6-hydroxymethyldihydropteridine diphosphokinase [Pseudomonadota bacterium]
MVERWRPAYIALGSNLDSPREHIVRACQELAALPGCSHFTPSGWYRSKPVGPQDQPDYINAAAGLLTVLQAAGLLHALQQIEQAHGRQREERWGARTLDLDLVFMPGVCVSKEALTLPHPAVAQRNFVLQPLAEICPHVVVDGHLPVAVMASHVGTDGLQRIGDIPWQ